MAPMNGMRRLRGHEDVAGTDCRRPPGHSPRDASIWRNPCRSSRSRGIGAPQEGLPCQPSPVPSRRPLRPAGRLGPRALKRSCASLAQADLQGSADHPIWLPASAGTAARSQRLRVFRSCPLITPKGARSSLQMLAIAGLWLCFAPRSDTFSRAARSRSKSSQPLRLPSARALRDQVRRPAPGTRHQAGAPRSGGSALAAGTNVDGPWPATKPGTGRSPSPSGRSAGLSAAIGMGARQTASHSSAATTPPTVIAPRQSRPAPTTSARPALAQTLSALGPRATQPTQRQRGQAPAQAAPQPQALRQQAGRRTQRGASHLQQGNRQRHRGQAQAQLGGDQRRQCRQLAQLRGRQQASEVARPHQRPG